MVLDCKNLEFIGPRRVHFLQANRLTELKLENLSNGRTDRQCSHMIRSLDSGLDSGLDVSIVMAMSDWTGEGANTVRESNR